MIQDHVWMLQQYIGSYFERFRATKRPLAHINDRTQMSVLFVKQGIYGYTLSDASQKKIE